MCCKVEDLAPLGPGYSMYYALKRNILWLLLILSIIYGIPAQMIIALKIWKDVPFSVPLFSMGNFYNFGFIANEYNKYPNTCMYLNCVVIIYLLIHSIYLRRMIVKMNLDLDKGAVTASDFTIIARNLPTTISIEVLKKKFEKHFSPLGIKVVYVNYTYKLDKFVKCTQQLAV